MTGGLGFIGSSFIRSLPSHDAVVNVDSQTYAADERRLSGTPASVRTITLDVRDGRLRSVIDDASPDVIVHFAAATHVTRGERDAEHFFSTNVEGSRGVFDAAAGYGRAAVVHVSTDEVYGPATERPFSEEDKQPGEGRATSAYARSKAVADDLARSYAGDLDIRIVRPTNCFGPWQHPEKAIPRWTVRALLGLRLPVWGDGGYVRDWMFVDDAVSAVAIVAERGERGGVYNIAPEGEALTNLQVAHVIAEEAGAAIDSVYTTAYDRPDHDRRYWIDASRIRGLGWGPRVRLEEALRDTVRWYRVNEEWWKPLADEAEQLYEDDQANDP
ncbi:MAG TPA: NAD-dependent epimerase/dehydratase family protein [Actinomycetota bacterium]|nr:NAD-dependent epimerase/dehydratase family protein [Actinomycetota bacterium]